MILEDVDIFWQFLATSVQKKPSQTPIQHGHGGLTTGTPHEQVGPFTLWLFNIAMENGPFIDDFPSYKPPFMKDFPWLC